jgi:hypothetical protein
VEPIEPDTAAARLMRPLHEVNEYCIAMLVQAARAPRPDAFRLVIQLGDLLRGITPEIHVRAARKAFLLVDLEFANGSWWQSLRSPKTRGTSSMSRGSFPRAGAIQLTRATLTLAWHVLHADEQGRCLLGVTPAVAEVINGLSLAEIDRIAERSFRHVRPRWEDRPAVWRQLLQSSQTPDIRRARESSLRCLQLITGELL